MFSTQEFKEFNYPFVPPKVKLQDLGANGKLLDDSTIQKLRESLAGKPIYRYSKKDFKIRYGIIKGCNEQLYAIYNYSESEQCHLGERGSFANPKIAQNLITGEWFILKTQKFAEKSQLSLFHQQVFESEHAALFALGKTKEPPIVRASKNPKSKIQKINMISTGGFQPRFFIEEIFLPKGNSLIQYEKGDDLFNLYAKRETGANQPSQWPDCFWLETAIGVLCAAKKDFHKNHYLHCDIKLENLLVDCGENKVALVDYGTVRKSESNQQLTYSTYNRSGTPIYQAPELRRKPFKFTEATEVYALGIVLKMLLFNVGIDDSGKEFHLSDHCGFKNHEAINLLVKNMTSQDPEKRPTLDDAIQSLKTSYKEYASQNPKELELVKLLRKECKEQETARLKAYYDHVQQQKSQQAAKANECSVTKMQF